MAKELTIKELVDAESNPDFAGLAFEKGLKLLEELVQGVESGSLPLEKSIRAYERGAVLMNYLKSLLEGAEQKLQVLQQPAKESR